MADPVEEALRLNEEIATIAGEALAVYRELHRHPHAAELCRVMPDTMPGSLEALSTLVFLLAALAQQGEIDDPREEAAGDAIRQILSTVYGLGIWMGRSGR